MDFYVKIKIFKKNYKNHFLNKNNLLLLVIIFTIIIKIKNSIKICWKIKIEQAVVSLDETPMATNLKWPLATPCQRTGRAGPLGGRATPRAGRPLQVAVGVALRTEAGDHCPLLPPLGFSLYKYRGWSGEPLTPISLSHFQSLTHSLALKFLSSIFQQILVQESSARIPSSS